MATFNDFRNKLVSILGSENVYFQPPTGFLMNYPCIVFTRNRIKAQFANNNPYVHFKQYTVKVIDPEPDSPITEKISKLPMSYFDRSYQADSLYHDIYNIYA